MKAREFQQFLAMETDATIGEIDQRTRFLRAAGKLQTGKRGPWAPDMKPAEAASMLLAMVSRRAADSEKMFERVADLQVVPGGSAEHIKGMKFADALTSTLTSPNDWRRAARILRVEIDEEGRFAWFRLEGSDLLFTNDLKMRKWVEDQPDKLAVQFTSGAHRCLVIGGAMLGQIALEIAPDFRENEQNAEEAFD